MQFVNPPSGEVMEGITAPLATEPFTGYPVDFTAFTACTKTTAVFPTQLCEEEPHRIISLYKGFKRFYIHDTILNWCQIFYNHLILLTPIRCSSIDLQTEQHSRQVFRIMEQIITGIVCR